jgi:hypothetical protein
MQVSETWGTQKIIHTNIGSSIINHPAIGDSPHLRKLPTMFSDELWDRATDDKMPNNSARWGIESHEIPWDEHPCGGCHKWGIPKNGWFI